MMGLNSAQSAIPLAQLGCARYPGSQIAGVSCSMDYVTTLYLFKTWL
jgi:hypothetical protein